jgi:hypothetical protein
LHIGINAYSLMGTCFRREWCLEEAIQTKLKKGAGCRRGHSRHFDVRKEDNDEICNRTGEED